MPLLCDISLNKSGDFRRSLCFRRSVWMLRDASRVVSSARSTFVVLLRFLLTLLSLFVIWGFVWTPTSVRCASDCVIERCQAALACFCHITVVSGTQLLEHPVLSTLQYPDLFLCLCKRIMQPNSVPFCWAAACVHITDCKSNWWVIKMQRVLFDFHPDSASLLPPPPPVNLSWSKVCVGVCACTFSCFLSQFGPAVGSSGCF